MGAIAAGSVDDAQVFERGGFIGTRLRIGYQHLAVTDDRHQTVAEIVNHAAGHFAERAQALLLKQLSLRGAQILERSFQFAGPFARPIFEITILILTFASEKVVLEKIPYPL